MALILAFLLLNAYIIYFLNLCKVENYNLCERADRNINMAVYTLDLDKIYINDSPLPFAEPVSLKGYKTHPPVPNWIKELH